MPWPLRRLLPLLALLAALTVLPGAVADEPEGGDDIPLDENEKVPFPEQVNRALDLGVRWLLGKPSLFASGGVEMAHWGLVKGERIYGGGDGPQYRHPAGPTALALYTLLKCGVPPEHPVIERGFNWLRELHDISPQWDGHDTGGRPRKWTHTVAGSSYELSTMILALTAKYDHYKKTQNTKLRRSRGKLRIKEQRDRVWLRQMVESLVARRGQTLENAIDMNELVLARSVDWSREEMLPQPPESELPPREQRRGWRYNLPHINLSISLGRGSEGYKRGGRLPPHANQDLSSTQLAALALYAAHQFGVEAPVGVWEDVVLFTLGHQEEDGPAHKRHDPVYSAGGYATPTDKARGFMYIRGSTDGSEGIATGSMTGCGIANLLLAKDVLQEGAKGKKIWSDRKWAATVDTAVWDGLAWLDRNWSPFRNPQSTYGYHIYYLYCLERAMDILGKNLVGRHNWYQEGAEQILSRQRATRARAPWDPRAAEQDAVYWMTGDTHEPKDVLDTCFALLFLKRATRDMVPGGVPVTGGGHGPTDNR